MPSTQPFADTPPPMSAPSLAPTTPHQAAGINLSMFGGPGALGAAGVIGALPQQQLIQQEESKIYQLVIDLMDVNTREAALLELSKKREQYDDLALVLWHSFGEQIVRHYI